MTELRTTGVLLALTIVGLSSTSALAVDGQAFADRLRAVASEQGTELAFGAVATEGETVVLSDLSLGSGEEEVELGNVRFETVTGSTEAGWRVERIPFADVDNTRDDTRTLATGMYIEGMTIAPPAAPGGEVLTPFQFERAGFSSIVFEQRDEEVARLGTLAITNTPTDGGGFSAGFDLDSFRIDTQSDATSEGARTMNELGYAELSGDITGQAEWETTSGTLSLSPLQINVADAGSLDFAYTISGYTPAFVQSLAALQQQMAASPDNSEASSMAVIGLVSQLYLNSAELSFTDQSLTERLLDFYAARNNQTREQLVGSLVGMLPIALSYLNNPEFQTEVSGAVESFLQNPQALTIAIAPDAPVPATQIIGAAMGAPQTLPAVLDVTVTSNP